MPFCENCGNNVSETAKFCSKCGTKIEGVFQPNYQGQTDDFEKFQKQFVTVESQQKKEKNNTASVLIYASLNDENGHLKWGLVDEHGEWVVNPKFDSLFRYNKKDIYGAVQNGKEGIIDTSGNWVVPPKFERLIEVEEKDIYIAKENSKYGVIDVKGNWIIEPNYDGLDEVKEKDVFIATENSKYGVIDIADNWIIPPVFDWLYGVKGKDIYISYRRGSYGVVDSKGNWIIQPKFDLIELIVEDVYKANEQSDLLIAIENEKRGIINLEGNWIIQPKFDYLVHISEKDDYIVEENGKYGVINSKGVWNIQPKYDNLSHIKEKDVYIAIENEKNGIIDLTGNWIIEPKFDWLVKVKEKDAYIAKENGKYGVIDAKGDWIIQPIYDFIGISHRSHDTSEINPASMTCCFDDNNLAVVKSEDKYGLINLSGEIIVPLQPFYLFDRDWSTPYYQASLNNKYGFIDGSTGQWVIEPKFDYNLITCFEEDAVGIWNEEEQKWTWEWEKENFGNQNLDGTYSSEDVLSSWFNLSHLKDYKRYYYLEKIPQKKLKEFCSSYTHEFVSSINFYVFYDDSLFGTGKNGFAIAKEKDGRWFLLINSLHGKYMIYFKEGAIRFPLGTNNDFAPTDSELRQAQLIIIRNWAFSKLTPYLRKRDWELFIGFLIYNGHFDPFSYLANVKMWRPEMADEIISRLDLNGDTDSKLKDSAGIR